MTRIYPLALRWLSLVSIALGARLIAQDVTVAPLAWLDPKDAPEELPVLGWKPRIEFPDELSKTPDIGWAMIDASVDDKGKVTAWALHSSQPAYKRAVELGSEVEHKFKPGRRGGVPVSTRVRLTVLFNPASAALKKADSTPRLLDAVVAIDPKFNRSPQDSIYPQNVVWAVVNVDATGRPTSIRDEPDALKELLESNVRAWRFEPARKAGVAVSAEVRVPFIVVPPDAVTGKNQTVPRRLSGQQPDYPLALRASGLRGDVVVEFTVNREGRVQDATVVRSLNPAFDQPALDAVLTWRFTPGRVNGRAVNTRMQQPISFSLSGESDGGRDGMDVQRRGDPAKFPEALRYDTPPKIDATILAKYPYELLKAGIHGSAQVSLLVGPDGKVAYSKISKADRPEFGLALQAAAELFEFMPALKGGQPTQALINFEQDFSLYHSSLVTDADRDALAVERRHPEQILRARDLDARPKVVVTRQPIFPRSLDPSIVHGEAVVEFLIDEKGEVRLPRVVSASVPIFGYAAVQAVAGWRFTPPTSKGKPGMTRVQLPIDFVAKPSQPPEAKP